MGTSGGLVPPCARPAVKDFQSFSIFPNANMLFYRAEKAVPRGPMPAAGSKDRRRPHSQDDSRTAPWKRNLGLFVAPGLPGDAGHGPASA